MLSWHRKIAFACHVTQCLTFNKNVSFWSFITKTWILNALNFHAYSYQMILFGWFSTTVSLILIYADVTKTIERERMWCLDFKTIQEVGFCTLHCSFWPKVRDMITPRKQLCTLITEKKCNRHCQRFCQEVPRAQGWNLESWVGFLGNFLLKKKKNIEGIIIYALWFGINVTFLLSEKSKREIRVFVKRPRGVTSHQLCIIPELQNLQENLGFLQTELCIVMCDLWYIKNGWNFVALK